MAYLNYARLREVLVKHFPCPDAILQSQHLMAIFEKIMREQSELFSKIDACYEVEIKRNVPICLKAKISFDWEQIDELPTIDFHTIEFKKLEDNDVALIGAYLAEHVNVELDEHRAIYQLRKNLIEKVKLFKAKVAKVEKDNALPPKLLNEILEYATMDSGSPAVIPDFDV